MDTIIEIYRQRNAKFIIKIIIVHSSAVIRNLSLLITKAKLPRWVYLMLDLLAYLLSDMIKMADSYFKFALRHRETTSRSLHPCFYVFI